MSRLWTADLAWLGGEDLAANILIEVSDGRFSRIETGTAEKGVPRLSGVVLPGLVNAHSHVFHRMLRGRTHRQGGDFWAWRDLMYQVASTLTPDDYEEVATAVYVEMALAGITTVGEFHYLHHQPSGVPYDDHNEMGHRLVRAARRAGIRISLLDAGYLTAGFKGQPLDPVQERFSDGTVGRWLDRVAELASVYQPAPDVRIGLAPHSVRAVPEAGLGELSERHRGEVPVHVHVSEQPAENEECLEATGLTPVGLLDWVGLLGPSTTAIHATHLTPDDIEALGSSGTGVCYCTTTERDLADGIGPGAALSAAGSKLCVGSDSHAVIDLFEEARGIELHHRLASGRRGTLSPAQLLEAATANGAAALGFDPTGLVVGADADFIVVSPDSPRMAGVDESEGVAMTVFSATSADVTDVFVAGRQIVSGGTHPEWTRARPVLG